MFPTDKIKSSEFKKHGFHRTPSEDFSDDGSRFLMYEYKGLQLSYHYSDEYGHFADLRPDYTPDLEYKTYSLFESYKNAGEFNGCKSVDLDKLEANAEAMVEDINKWVENPNFAREAKQKEEDDFKQKLGDMYLGQGSQAQKDAVFAQAWEYGHSDGFSEVENYYIDLASLVKVV